MDAFKLAHTDDPTSSHIAAVEPEIWRPVLGHEGLFEVSNRGNVRSVTRRLSDGRLWRGRPVAQITQSRSGYQMVNLNHPKKFRTVHSIVLEAFVGPRPAGMFGLHWNDIPNDNRLENLRWGTASDNKRDEVRNGRHYNANRTHCPRGHLLEAPNLTRPTKDRYRRCLACERARGAANRKGLPLDPRIADLKYSQILASNIAVDGGRLA